MKNLLKGGKPLDSPATALPGKEKPKPRGEKSQSPSGPKVCIFYNAPGGCKKGKDCTYKHVKDGKGSGKKNDNRGRSKTRSSSPNNKGGKGSRSHSPKPKDVCKFFQAGNCKFGTDCHMKHEGKPSASPAKEDKTKKEPANRDKKKKEQLVEIDVCKAFTYALKNIKQIPDSNIKLYLNIFFKQEIEKYI
jgi:hypothetical protein